ncbi:MAG: hypothetical protein KF729_24595 [Sandaracinaceae bacterium]|nr:hypothetical protein [Sandaracinaceae bacterium]
MNDVHIEHGTTLRLGEARITFQRTLRIPDDGRSYPLPPGLGCFPLRRVADYAARVPDGWAAKGGVFLPMYQREAMWLSFGGAGPHALKVGIGKVCAVSGEPWRDGLRSSPQDYVVTGAQPWLDGIASDEGTIRQFVAMPLGMGYTVEAQVTGEETHGGIQLQAYAPKPGRLVGRDRLSRGAVFELACAGPPPACSAPTPRRRIGAMGLAAGGRMKQKVYPDPHGLDTWDLDASARVFVHIVNSELWREITGEEPPATPVTARSYASAGLPWFELYDERAPTLAPTETLAKIKSVKELDADKFGSVLQDDAPVSPGPIRKLLHAGLDELRVSDGEW